MGEVSDMTDKDLSDWRKTAENVLHGYPSSPNIQSFWGGMLLLIRAEQRRRADPIIVKHIGRSTWQGTQSEWEKRV